MKRTFATIALTAALLLTIGAGSSFALPHTTLPVSGRDNITASFKKNFRNAELLSTDIGKDYTRLSFKMNGMILSAYYSDNGELLAITHNIQSTQLPLQLLMQVKRNYASYWISDLFEYNANGSSTYFLTLENANSKITLRSNDGDWETYNKTSKQ
jgi:WD40 repeat protein